MIVVDVMRQMCGARGNPDQNNDNWKMPSMTEFNIKLGALMQSKRDKYEGSQKENGATN